MRLPRILNQCHPIPGFVYGQASFAEDGQAVLIPIRPRKRSAAICSEATIRLRFWGPLSLIARMCFFGRKGICQGRALFARLANP
jgi:hypothetical protein